MKFLKSVVNMAKIRKEWYDLIAPEILSNKVYGSTLSSDSKLVKGRKVKLPLNHFINTDKYYLNVILKVNAVENNRALSSLNGIEISREYLYRMVRRGSDKLDIIEDVETKDGKKIRVKMVGITLKRSESNVLKNLRKKIVEILKNFAEKSNYEDFMKSIFQDTFQKKVMEGVKKIYPLKAFEVRKVEILK